MHVLACRVLFRRPLFTGAKLPLISSTRAMATAAQADNSSADIVPKISKNLVQNVKTKEVSGLHRKFPADLLL